MLVMCVRGGCIVWNDRACLIFCLSLSIIRRAWIVTARELLRRRRSRIEDAAGTTTHYSTASIEPIWLSPRDRSSQAYQPLYAFNTLPQQNTTNEHLQYLLALTVIAAYALHSSTIYSLPIPNAMPALTIALPPLAGIALETCISLNQKLAAKGQLQTSRIFQITIAVFLVYETVVATLAGTHLAPPGSLDCGLRERWQGIFDAKDAGRVRVIQDAFRCCGLKSVKDMAWPFPDAMHQADACVRRYERDTACLGPWRAEERKVAVLLLVVPVAVFIWMVRYGFGCIDTQDKTLTEA